MVLLKLKTRRGGRVTPQSQRRDQFVSRRQLIGEIADQHLHLVRRSRTLPPI